MQQNRTLLQNNVFFTLSTPTTTTEKIYVSDETKPFSLPQRLPTKADAQGVTMIGENRIPERLGTADETHTDIFY